MLVEEAERRQGTYISKTPRPEDLERVSDLRDSLGAWIDKP